MTETGARLEGLVEEYLGRLRRGERPPLTEYVERHPELAEQIKEVFPALALVEQYKPTSGEVTDDRVPCPIFTGGGPELTRLGDFRILRVIGRGGMGVVYEAEQETLGRHVALKVLPSHAAQDETTVERFRREARAAARLHHTNIVPVFEVGQEGGVCYYAMQFIRGQGLDRVIEDMRRLRDQPHDEASGPGSSPTSSGGDPAPWRPSPQPQPISRVARSLVIGRFAPPPLDPDGGDSAAAPAPSPVSAATFLLEAPIEPGATPKRGSPAVESAAGIDAGPSPSSSAVLPGGAELSAVDSGHRPYYLSVARIGEQAAQALAYAHSRGIVHRDIKPSNLLLDSSGVVWLADFGLGLVIDEASRLTGSGDIVGTLRYLAPERLRGECDARADLYALGLTLYELLTLRPAFEARDRLLLIDQIKGEEATSPRAIDRRIPRDLETIVLKAMAKEPTRRYQAAAELADDLRRFIEDRPIRARKITLPGRLGRWHRRNPVVAGLLWTLLIVLSAGLVGMTALYWNADREHRRADANFHDARAAVDDYLTTVSGKLLDVPGLQPLRRELLERALRYYQVFITQQGSDPSLRSDLGNAYERVGMITGLIGSRPDALTAHRRALDIRTALARDYPEGVEFRQGVAKSQDQIAVLLRGLGRHEESERSSREAIAILEPLLGGHPQDVSLRSDLARSLNNLGILKKSTGHLAEAETLYRRAIEILEHGTDGDADGRQALAHSYANLGSLKAMGGKMDEAGRWLQKAIPIFEASARARPEKTQFRQELGKTLGNLGTLQSLTNQPEAAIRSFRRAVEFQEPLAREHPSVVEFQQDLAKAYTDLGGALEATAKDDAVRSYQHAVETLDSLVKAHPKVVSIHQDLARSLVSLSALQMEAAKWHDASPSLERALAIAEPLARDHPDDPENTRYLSLARIGLGKVRSALDQPAEALKHWQEAVRLIESFREPIHYDLYNLACAYALSSSVTDKLRTRSHPGDAPAASVLLDRAMDALRRAVAAGWSDDRAMEHADLKSLSARDDYRALLAKVRGR